MAATQPDINTTLPVSVRVVPADLTVVVPVDPVAMLLIVDCMLPVVALLLTVLLLVSDCASVSIHALDTIIRTNRVLTDSLQFSMFQVCPRVLPGMLTLLPVLF
jgi:hypothetical protein